MATGETPITLVGNVASDPELRFTPAGVAVCNFRIASTPRVWDKGANGWADGDPLFLTCNIWRAAAENVAESLTKGMRIIIHGRLKQRQYETKEGDRRTVIEVEVDEVGPSLKFSTAQITRNPRHDHPTSSRASAGYQPPQQHPGTTWAQPATQESHPSDEDTPPF